MGAARPAHHRAHPGALVVVLGPPSPAVALARRAAVAASAGHRDRRTLLVDLTRLGVLDAGAADARSATGLGPLLAIARVVTPDRRAVDRAVEPHPAGYWVVRGAGHPHAWTTVRAEAAARAVEALTMAADVVVAVADPDLDGEAETGSVDLEERHALARASVRTASAIAVADDGTPVGTAVALATAAAASTLAGPTPTLARFGADGRAIRSGGAAATIGELVSASIDRARRARPPLGSPGSVPRPIAPGDLGTAGGSAAQR